MAAENTQSVTTRGMGREIGKSGTTMFGGIITGEDYNPKLTGKQAIRNYETMRRSDATVHSALQVCKLPIMSVKWKINPAADNDAEIARAKYLNRELFERNVVFNNLLREGLTCLDFGFSVAEKTLELTDFDGTPMIGIKKIGFRKQVSIIKWETDDGKPGITQQLLDGSPNANIIMPKLMIFTNDREGDNYEGISLLRYAYKHWNIKDKLDLINAIALEKQGVGVPVLKKPPNADAAELATARDILRNFRANESAFIEVPVGWDVEMMDMKANTTAEIIPSIQYHDRQIMKSVLAQFMELGATSASGARAVSEDHSKIFLLSEEATAKNIQQVIQEQLIKQLCDLNYTNFPDGYPQLVFEKIGTDDPTTAAESMSKFVTAGLLTAGAEIEEHVREILHLPKMTKEAIAIHEAKQKATLSDPTATKPATGATDKKVDPATDKLPSSKKKNTPEQNKKDVAAAALDRARAAREELILAVSRA